MDVNYLLLALAGLLVLANLIAWKMHENNIMRWHRLKLE